MAVLLACLLKWQFQPARRSKSWERTIREQRRALAIHNQRTPSLRISLGDKDWVDAAWADAVAKATGETGLDLFLEVCL